MIAKYKGHIILAGIILSALILRFIGIQYGLPFFYIGDEKSIVYGSLKMIELKTLLPVMYPDEFRPLYYPPLMSYIYLIFLIPVLSIKYLFSDFSSIAEFKDYMILNPTVIWITVRSVNAVIGAATIYLVYRIGKILFGKNIGLFSALFLNLSFLHLSLSHFTRHWVPATFFLTLTMLYASYIFLEPKFKHYIIIGIVMGLAFGISYITAIGFIFFIIAHFFPLQNGAPRINVSGTTQCPEGANIPYHPATRDWYRDKSENAYIIKKFKDRKLWIAILIFIFISSVFILLHPQEFTRIIFGEDSTAQQPKNIFNLLETFFYHIKNLFFIETILFLFSILGLFIIYRRQKSKLIFLTAFPVIYIITLYFFFHSEVRYAVFILPTLAVLAGYAVNYLYEKFFMKRSRSIIAALFIFFVFLPQAMISLKYIMLLETNDTRIRALDWIKNNISEGEKIVTDTFSFSLIPNRESILLQQQIDPSSLRREDRTLINLNTPYPSPAYSILRVHAMQKKLPQGLDFTKYIKEKGYQYFIIEVDRESDISDRDGILVQSSELLKEFKPSRDIGNDLHGNLEKPIYNILFLDRLGPKVQIYKIRDELL